MDRPPVPLKTAFCPAGLMSVRARLFPEVVVKAMPPLAVVVPVPLWVPALQVNRPETLMASDPASVPALSVRVEGAIVSPLLNVVFPPPTASAPTLVTVEVGEKVTTPKVQVVDAVTS